MSVDYCIYTLDDRPIALDELRTAVCREGWHLVAVRGYYDPKRFRVVRMGALHDGDYLFGWQLTDPCQADYEAALLRKDFDLLNRWSVSERTEALGACDFSTNKFHAKEDLDPDDLTELARRVPDPEYVGAIRLAKVEYVLELHSDAVFLDEVARQICQLRGGAWTYNCDICEVSEKGGPTRRLRLPDW